MRCPYGICDGSGYVVDDASREAGACRCLPEQIVRRTAKGLRGQIPRKYADVSFQHSDIAKIDSRVLGLVREYVDDLPARLDSGEGLWFTGGTGTGKTSLAMLISKEARDRGRSIAVYSLPRLLSEIRRTYDGVGVTTLGLLDQLTAVDLLHIDDVGAEQSTPWVLEQLYAIVNARYEDERSVTITTNLDPVALRDQVGERTVSRLEEMCRVVTIPDEVDHRTAMPHRLTGGDPSRRAAGAVDHPAPPAPVPVAEDPGPVPSWVRAGRREPPPTWGTDPGGLHRPVRRERDHGDR